MDTLGRATGSTRPETRDFHGLQDEIEDLRANIPPASRLPKAIEAWEVLRYVEFTPRTAWSLFNAFTEIQKTGPPRAQMEGSLRLSLLFRRELQLS